MFNIKTIIVTGLSTIGAATIFALIQHFAPLWLWLALVGIGFFAFLLLCAYEPKKKPQYWFSIIEYLDEAGNLCTLRYIKKEYGKPFFNEKELELIDRIVRFHITEISEDTYFLIKEEINQQNQQENGTGKQPTQ